MAQNIINGADSFPLMAVPFFMLAGEIMNTGGLSKRIVNLALSLVGHVKRRTGLCHHLAACILAGAVRLGRRRRRGAVRAAGADDGRRRPRQGALGGVGRSVGHHRPGHPAEHRFRHLRRRRRACRSPSCSWPASSPAYARRRRFAVAWWWVVRKENLITPPPRKSRSESSRASIDGFWALMLPVIIIFGLKFGIFTPTEAARGGRGLLPLRRDLSSTAS